MIKYFIVSLLVGYILRKFIFYPINQPRPNGYDQGQSSQQYNDNQKSATSKPTKKFSDEEYTDYEEVK